MTLTEKCPKCKTKVDWFNKKDGTLEISGKFIFHMKDTHGWPVNFTIEWIKKTVKVIDVN